MTRTTTRLFALLFCLTVLVPAQGATRSGRKTAPAPSRPESAGAEPPEAKGNEALEREEGCLDGRIRDYLQRHGDHGKIEPEWLLETSAAIHAELQNEEPDAGINGTAWNSIGPTNGAGRATAIAVHPTVAGTVIVGAAGGGAWKTTNSGATWTPLTDTIPNLSIGAVAIAASNPSIIYLGTGEGGYAGDFIPGIGLLASANGGTTWTLPSSPLASEFYRLMVDPANPQIVIAGTNTGGLRSTGGQNGPWTTVIRNSSSGATVGYGDVTDIVRDPSNAQVLYATTWDHFNWCARNSCFDPYNLHSPTVLKSADGGQTWSPAATNLPLSTSTKEVSRMSIAIAPSSPQTLYVAFSTYDSTTFNSTSHVYKTVNGGTSWSETALSANGQVNTYLGSGNGQSWYDNTIVVSPTDPNTVLAGGVQIVRTTDGGSSWTLPLFAGGGIHVDHHDLRYDAGGTLYFACDGGVWTTTDAGSNSVNRNAGLVTRQFYTLANDPIDRNRMFGGQQDNGTVRRPDAGGMAWDDFFGGDGFGTVVNAAVPSTVLVSWQYEHILRSKNAGSASPVLEYTTPMFQSEPVPFATNITADPSNPNTVYTASHRLWKSVTGGETWYPLSISTTDGSFWATNAPLRAIAVARTNPQVLMVSQYDTVFRSTNGGASWVGASSGLPGAGVNFIEIDPTDANRAYVALATTLTSVYTTSNGGLSWTATGSGLPAFAAQVVRVDPLDPTTIYCGTDVGVYRSTNSGGSWTRFGTGLPAVSVYDLQTVRDGSILRAATHGRGVWELVIPSTGNQPPVVSVSAPGSSLTVARGVPVNFTGTFSDPNGDPVSGSWNFSEVPVAVAATSGVPVSHRFDVAGHYQCTLVATDSHGAMTAANVDVTVTESGESCSNPLVVPASGPFPYNLTVTTEGASTQASDPAPVASCYPYAPQSSVWLSFTPAVSGTYQFSLCGSHTSAALAGFTGNACGSYTAVSGFCALDFGGDGDCSGVTAAFVSLTAGTTYRVMLTNYYGNEFGPITLTVTRNSVFTPLVSSVSPHGGAAAGGTTVTITGIGFSGSPVVQFGGVAATNVSLLTPNLITATTPAHATGVVDVTVQSGGLTTAAGAYSYFAGSLPPVTRGDFNADSRADLFWRNAATGANAVWFMSGTTQVNTPTNTVADTNWRVSGTGDFDGDGKADVLWRSIATGSNALWLMNGATVSNQALPAIPDLNWRIAGTGDFDHDGKADIFWRNSTTGANAIWFMNGSTATNVATNPVADTNWTVAGIGDFDADGRADLFWRNTATGANAVWLMNGSTPTNVSMPNVSVQWAVAAVGDVDNDGRADLIWRNQTSGGNAVWLMNGTTQTNVNLPAVADVTWFIVAAGDFDGDGKADLFWRRSNDGSNAVWLMNGTTSHVNVPFTAVADTNWGVVLPR